MPKRCVRSDIAINPERSFICPSRGLNVELGASISGYADERLVIDAPPPMGARMKRRDFLRSAAGAGAVLGVVGRSVPTLASAETLQACAEPSFPKVQQVTAHVSEFVVNLKFSDIPAES